MVTRTKPRKAPKLQSRITDYPLHFLNFWHFFLNSSYSNHLLNIKTSPKSDIIDKSYQGNKVQWLTFVTYPDWVVPYFFSKVFPINLDISYAVNDNVPCTSLYLRFVCAYLEVCRTSGSGRFSISAWGKM